MTQLVIEKEVNAKVEEAFAAEKGKETQRYCDRRSNSSITLDLQIGYMESIIKSIRQEIQASKGEESSAAKDEEFKNFLDTDSDATAGSSWYDTDKDDAENSNMDISDDDLIKDMMMR
uniref:Uncharacterized protein n=1 Tax=Tanacetum cinerariifolium TaxID=118510 RepID=A0A6L2MML1_TANCI|nr:hypothetical protein [Tanacetum cinerariifolium]